MRGITKLRETRDHQTLIDRAPKRETNGHEWRKIAIEHSCDLYGENARIMINDQLGGIDSV